MACFADLNVSQGILTRYAKCGGILNIHLIANLPRNLPVKIFSIEYVLTESMVVSLWPTLFGPPCICYIFRSRELVRRYTKNQLTTRSYWQEIAWCKVVTITLRQFTELTETTTVQDSDGVSKHRLMPISPTFYISHLLTMASDSISYV